MQEPQRFSVQIAAGLFQKAAGIIRQSPSCGATPSLPHLRYAGPLNEQRRTQKTPPLHSGCTNPDPAGPQAGKRKQHWTKVSMPRCPACPRLLLPTPGKHGRRQPHPAAQEQKNQTGKPIYPRTAEEHMVFFLSHSHTPTRKPFTRQRSTHHAERTKKGEAFVRRRGTAELYPAASRASATTFCKPSATRSRERPMKIRSATDTRLS